MTIRRFEPVKQRPYAVLLIFPAPIMTARTVFGPAQARQGAQKMTSAAS